MIRRPLSVIAYTPEEEEQIRKYVLEMVKGYKENSLTTENMPSTSAPRRSKRTHPSSQDDSAMDLEG
jgi:hypothetical protein